MQAELRAIRALCWPLGTLLTSAWLRQRLTSASGAPDYKTCMCISYAHRLHISQARPQTSNGFDVNQNKDSRQHHHIGVRIWLLARATFVSISPRTTVRSVDRQCRNQEKRKSSGTKTTTKENQIADGGATVEKTRATTAKGKVETKKAAIKLAE
jgi:hypothetical protein